jgi:hypothetical protein
MSTRIVHSTGVGRDSIGALLVKLGWRAKRSGG